MGGWRCALHAQLRGGGVSVRVACHVAVRLRGATTTTITIDITNNTTTATGAAAGASHVEKWLWEKV